MIHIRRTVVLALFFLSSFSPMDGQERYALEGSMPVFYEQLKKEAVETLPQKNLRRKVMATMQIAPPAPQSVGDYEVLAHRQRDGYEAQEIAFYINRWEKVKAYLLVPDAVMGGKEKAPAILLLHDHGGHFTIGKEKMVCPVFAEGMALTAKDSLVIADAEQWVKACYDGVYVGDELARQGYVVLSIDALFWGDRCTRELAEQREKASADQLKALNKSVYDRQQALASNMLQMGTSWGAWITWDDIRAAEFLASLPVVDKGRVGCLGFSMGAYRSWMLAALSDAVKASASICWMNDTEHLMTLTNNQNKGGSAFAMLVPGIRNVADYPLVASLAAPKPALFFNGTRDKLFPVEGVEACYKVMRKAWHNRKADGNLVTRLWDEKHFFNREMQKEVVKFFRSAL